MSKQEIEKKGGGDKQTILKEGKKSVFDKIKKGGGVAAFEGPNVKERKKFAPPGQTHDVKKGKGSYKRKKAVDEDEELGSVPLKGGKSKSSKRKVFFGDEDSVPLKDGSGPKRRPLEGKRRNRYEFNESTNIYKFVESLITKDHAKAHEFLKDAIGEKIKRRIEAEIDTPLF